MNTNELWEIFARTGSVSDYLNYRDAVNKRVEENARKYGRNYFKGTEYRREGQARYGAHTPPRAY